jgi:hypothetical protein
MRHDIDSTHGEHRTNGDRTMRLTVPEAAGVMDISAEAVRQRIKRGTLPTEKYSTGTVHVILSDSLVGDSTPDSTALIESLREQVAYLKETVAKRDEEIRRRDHLLAAALEHIPALEEPSEARESPVSSSGEASKGAASPEHQPSQRRSWLQRFFFGP